VLIASASVALLSSQGQSVPGAPQQLQADVIGNIVVLRWLAPASGAPPIAYIIEAGSAQGLSDLARITTGPDLSLIASAPNGTYYVRTRAVGSGGAGPPSNEIQVNVGQGTCAPPGRPQSLTATTAGSMVTFSWAASSGSGTVRYEIRAGSRPGDRALARLNVGTSTAFVVSAPAGTYFVVVVALSDCGESAESNEAVVVVGSDSERSFIDLPDDVPGFQVHVMYVLPSDGTDERLDVTGAIRTSVAAIQTWLQRETNGQRLRLDTYQGRLDVTFVRLGRTDSEYGSYGVYVPTELGRDLAARDFNSRNKIYALFYGGGHYTLCGSTSDNIAGVYLKGEFAGQIPCAAQALTSNVNVPRYQEFLMLHEITHAMGFVDQCAPHHSAMHVTDSSSDVMYSGPNAWSPMHYDINRDDYFAHGGACADVSRNVFITPTMSPPQPPPSWTSGRFLSAPVGGEGEPVTCELGPPPH
jgi:hypothetical protein